MIAVLLLAALTTTPINLDSLSVDRARVLSGRVVNIHLRGSETHVHLARPQGRRPDRRRCRGTCRTESGTTRAAGATLWSRDRPVWRQAPDRLARSASTCSMYVVVWPRGDNVGSMIMEVTRSASSRRRTSTAS